MRKEFHFLHMHIHVYMHLCTFYFRVTLPLSFYTRILLNDEGITSDNLDVSCQKQDIMA